MPVQRAGFGPTLALTATLALGCVAAVTSLVMLLSEPTPLPAPLSDQNQDAETALYVIAFFVILPLALIVGPRIADSIAAGPNAAALSPLTGLIAATFAATVLAVRVSGGLPWGDGVAAMLGGVGAWWVAATAMVARARRGRWPAMAVIGRRSGLLWAIAGGLVLAAVVGLTAVESLSVPVAALAALAIPAVLAARRRGLAARIPPRWGAAFDVAVVALLLAAVPDLVIFRPEEVSGDFAAGFETSVIQFHQNLLLGPVNEVLAGSALLVDAASQYGVAPLYLIAGWFQLAPPGYGTLGILDDVVTALVFVAAYCLLRIAGCPRPLAAGALGIGLLALVYNLPYSVGALPQQGQLRFGLPLTLIVVTVAGLRWPARAGVARAAAFAILALSAVWSLEAFAVAIASGAAMAAMRAWALPANARLGWLARTGAVAAGACVGAHLILAAATLAAAGQLPDWGQYFAFLEGFLFGKLGDLTYDFAAWSPALAVGALYLASAAAIVLLVRRHADLVRREGTAIVALCGTTAYGIALFNYFVDRSAGGILPYVALPALLTAALWLSLLLRSGSGVSRAGREGGLAGALAVAALLTAAAWPAVGERFERSALAHAPPGGRSLRDALDRLWHPPPLNPLAPEGQRLLARYMPGQERVLVLTMPDLSVEILVRSGRGSELRLGDPWEDSFIGSERLPVLREALANLRSGDRILIDQPSLDVFAVLAAQPNIDPLTDLTRSGSLAPLQSYALAAIGDRFRLQPLHRSEHGLIVARLAPRRVRA